MPLWDFYRTVDSMRLLAELAVEYGVAESQVLEGTGVSVDQLYVPDLVVEARQELRLISNLVERLGHVPALGVIAGQRYHFNTFGALGFALVSSPTFGAALDVGLRYVQLTFAFCQLSIREQGELTCIDFDASELAPGLRQFIIERDSSCLITLQRDVYNKISPLKSLCFSFPEPESKDVYREFYRVLPEFDAPVTTLTLSRSMLSEIMPQASEQALRSAEQQCEYLLNQRLKRGGLSAQVRQYLAARASEMPGMDDVALAMNTIPRTLRRKLQQENTTFAELRDEVRQALADEYLAGPRLSVERVAERLGYSGPTAFINAYKRWYGTTPANRRSQSSRGVGLGRRSE
ncbi:AraC family transcriptional regulator [Marinobacter zhejiangensis]|uniref:AraC-type DNA-binding protein n=1 Tax=Marinobacter zhejiangensis TaxID=488535 RepID=A0A1I4PFY8_9GAMM|nr:AraC family transcriptional regulator [Marinobacter zhejiangensis]SFM26607.1 AraC-type DNA-binding protein [Marinobacter zhejiangensis]